MLPIPLVAYPPDFLSPMLPIFPTHLGSLSLPRSHSTYIMTIPQSTYPSWHLSLCLPIPLSTYHPCHLSFSPTYPSWHLFLLSTYHLSCPPFSVPIPLSTYHQYPITHAAYPQCSYPSWHLYLCLPITHATYPSVLPIPHGNYFPCLPTTHHAHPSVNLSLYQPITDTLSLMLPILQSTYPSYTNTSIYLSSMLPIPQSTYPSWHLSLSTYLPC